VNPSAAAARRAQQPERATVLHRLRPRVHVELGVQLAHVRLDGVHGPEQLVADLARGQVRGQEAQDGELALAERLRERARAGPAGSAPAS